MKAIPTCLAALVLGAIAAGPHASAQVKISSLPPASALTGGELLPAVQGGADVVVTPNQIKTFAGGGGGTPGGSPGQLQYDNAGAFGGFSLAGDCAITVPNITCLATGGVNFGSFATQNYATPPAIGGVTPAAGSFSTLNDNALTASLNVCADASKNLTSACANEVPIANLAQIGANTVLGNGAGSAGNVTALSTSGSGPVVEATSPTLVTPTLGAATATTLNGDTFTTGTYTLTGTAGKTLTFSNTLTLAGTDGTTMTFPSTTSTVMTLNTPGTTIGTLTIGSGAGLVLSGTGSLQANAEKLFIGASPTAGTVTGGTVTVTRNAGSGSQKYTITGSPSSSAITLAMPTATNGYVCDGVDITAGTRLQETTDSATAPVLTAYTPAGVATSFATNDVLLVKCTAY